MSNILIRKTAPAITPISKAEVKLQLRVEHNDDDTYIDSLILAAVDYVDAQGVLGRSMITQTWEQYIGQNPRTVVLLGTPTKDLVSIGYYDVNGALQSDSLTNYDLFGTPEYKTIRPKYGQSWPTTQKRDDAYIITYKTGYGDAATDVPASIRQALLLLVAHWYENREPELIGTSSKTLPFGFDVLIDSHRTDWYG